MLYIQYYMLCMEYVQLIMRTNNSEWAQV